MHEFNTWSKIVDTAAITLEYFSLIWAGWDFYGLVMRWGGGGAGGITPVTPVSNLLESY